MRPGLRRALTLFAGGLCLEEDAPSGDLLRADGYGEEDGGVGAAMEHEAARAVDAVLVVVLRLSGEGAVAAVEVLLEDGL